VASTWWEVKRDLKLGEDAVQRQK